MVSRAGACCLLDDYETELDFDKMFDLHGEETMDGLEAVSATVQMPNGDWCTLDLTRFEPPTYH